MSEALARPLTLSDRNAFAAREAVAGRRRGLRALLPFAGPAVIASIAYVDPGNFATNIQAGAQFGYMLLWVVVAANLVAMLFQATIRGTDTKRRSEESRFNIMNS